MRRAYERAYTSRIIWQRFYGAKTVVDAQWAARDYDERELNARRYADYSARKLAFRVKEIYGE